MISNATLPPWENIFAQTGLKPLKHGRGHCPFCDSRTGFSCNDEKGFNCFACNVHGDKIAFIQKLNDWDFKDTLRYFGMEPGKPPKPDPKTVRQGTALERVRQWVRTTGKRLRDEYYNRQRITVYARKRLAINPVDATAWELLRIAYDGEAKNEFLLDEIDLRRGDSERLEAWRKYRNEF